jgi:transcription termination/antitermination protein NusA
VTKEFINLAHVIDELVEERGLDREALSAVICESMLAAYSKKYPTLHLKIDYDKQSGEINVLVEKKIVATVQDEDAEISLKKARNINSKAEIDETLWLPFEGTIGRIDILRAKQVIASNIRTMESNTIYNEFKDREDTIIHGVVHKLERGGTVIKIDDALAFLPRSLSIPDEKLVVGFPLRALLKEVLLEPRNDNQLILDRASEEFLKELFELEIPEVFEKLVEVKKIVRIPGYKSKVVVASNDKDIDPVGTCIGVRGSRIQPILKELGGEKIDIIAWNDALDTFIKNALKPAQINRVQLSDDNKDARVWLDEDQRSLAIGKLGQNIALASRLTGVDIQLVQPSAEDKSAVSMNVNNEEGENRESMSDLDE